MLLLELRYILHYYSQLHFSAPSFRAIFRLECYLLKKVKYTIDSIVDCEISHYISKIFKI